MILSRKCTNFATVNHFKKQNKYVKSSKDTIISQQGARFGLKIEEMVKDFKEDMIKYEQNMYRHRTE